VHWKSAGQKRLFLLFVGKAHVFSTNPCGNSPYKDRLPCLELEQFKRKAILGASEGVFLSYPCFSKVCVYLLVTCL